MIFMILPLLSVPPYHYLDIDRNRDGDEAAPAAISDVENIPSRRIG
jgi:hypothetical protein